MAEWSERDHLSPRIDKAPACSFLGKASVVPVWRKRIPPPYKTEADRIWFHKKRLALGLDATTLRSLRFFFRLRGFFDLDRIPVLQCSQYLIATGDDLVFLREAFGHLNVSTAGDPGLYGDELNLPAAASLFHLKDALDLFILLRGGLWSRRRGGPFGGSLVASRQLARGADGQGLDGNRQHVFLLRGGDLGGGAQSGAKIVRSVVDGDDNFEVFGFLAAGGGL